jgi:lambda repressor-like predicted transcriptional regulator
LHELEDIIDNLIPEISKRQEKLEIKKEGADVVKKGSDGIILKLKTKEAACYYGKGTKWCTAGNKNNAFDEYNEDGPLYVFISNDGRKFQFHFESWQFTDEKDQKINVKELMEKYPTVNSFFKDKEKDITKNAYDSYQYAVNVIEGRFPEGEKIIAADVLYSYQYARDVIEGRFPEGEKIIATDVVYSYYYALNVIEGRFPEGERIIATDAEYSVYYAIYVIKSRFPEGEKIIATDAYYLRKYKQFLNSIK